MTTSFKVDTTTRNDEAIAKQQDRSIFVLQLHDGKIVVGSASNPCKRIAAINSGLTPGISKALQVNKIIGIKPMEEGRNVVSVFKHFEARYGRDNVIAV